ncbi:hypothetical protein H8959_004175 [Pygathrix nigripes]
MTHPGCKAGHSLCRETPSASSLPPLEEPTACYGLPAPRARPAFHVEEPTACYGLPAPRARPAFHVEEPTACYGLPAPRARPAFHVEEPTACYGLPAPRARPAFHVEEPTAFYGLPAPRARPAFHVEEPTACYGLPAPRARPAFHGHGHIGPSWVHQCRPTMAPIGTACFCTLHEDRYRSQSGKAPPPPLLRTRLCHDRMACQEPQNPMSGSGEGEATRVTSDMMQRSCSKTPPTPLVSAAHQEGIADSAEKDALGFNRSVSWAGSTGSLPSCVRAHSHAHTLRTSCFTYRELLRQEEKMLGSNGGI